MRILDRYITRQFIPPFICCILSFIFLYIILDLFGHIDEILRERVGLAILARYYLSFVPLIFVQTSPIAILLATLYILSTLNRNNEITAMRACGASLFRIISPFLIIGIMVSVFTFLINDKVVPQSSLISATIKEEKIEKKVLSKGEKKLSDVTFYGTKNRLFYIKSYDPATTALEDIIILVHDKKNIIRQKIIAEKARWEESGWRLTNAIIYRLNRRGEVIGDPEHYEEKIIEIDESPEDLHTRQQEPMFMSYRKLENYILKFRGISPQILRRLSVELYSKVSLPFVNLVIILIGIPLALMTKMRGGILRGIGVSIAIGFIYYCFMAVSCALGKAGVFPPFISAWLANIIFGTAGIILIVRI